MVRLGSNAERFQESGQSIGRQSLPFAPVRPRRSLDFLELREQISRSNFVVVKREKDCPNVRQQLHTDVLVIGGLPSRRFQPLRT